MSAESKYPLEVRIQVLEPALNLVRGQGIKDWLTECIRIFPDYFFEVPASISGKYHPMWALGPGGLARHTVAVATMAHGLGGTFELDERFETDVITAAGIVHDSLKYGVDFNPVYHDVHMFTPKSYFKFVTPKLAPNIKDMLFGCVERHMGSYMSGKWSGASGVKPRNPIEGAMHIADYVVSRKEFVFDRYVNYHTSLSNQPKTPHLEHLWDDLVDGKFWWERLDTRHGG